MRYAAGILLVLISNLGHVISGYVVKVRPVEVAIGVVLKSTSIDSTVAIAGTKYFPSGHRSFQRVDSNSTLHCFGMHR